VRVAIADDSRPFRIGLEALLVSVGVEVSASVGTGAALLEAVCGDPPDVAIVDIRMPPTRTDEGLLAAREIRRRLPEVAVLMLSADQEAFHAARPMVAASRAAGYVLKTTITTREALRAVLDRLATGDTVVDADIAALIAATSALAAGAPGNNREATDHDVDQEPRPSTIFHGTTDGFRSDTAAP
jgi:DNA-binding NarL/FixJ family response regulator